MTLSDLICAIEPMLSAEVQAELFRRRRVRLLTSENSPIALLEGFRVFLHVVPPGANAGFKSWSEMVEAAQAFEPGQGDAWISGLNVDGFQVSGPEGTKLKTHVQYYCSGSLEYCQAYPIRKNTELSLGYLPIDVMTGFIGFSLGRALGFLEQSKIAGPHFAAVTVIGVQGSVVQANPRTGIPNTIDRNELWLKPMHLAGPGEAFDHAVSEIADILYAAGGVKRR